MLSAGWAAYVQGRLPEALKHTERPLPRRRLGEAFFQAAKIQMAAMHQVRRCRCCARRLTLIPAIWSGSRRWDFRRHEGILTDSTKRCAEQFVPGTTGHPGAEEVERWPKTVQEDAECQRALERCAAC